MSDPRQYHLNDELKIWETPLHNPTSYSDGDVIEADLLSILRRCKDVSAMSDELQSYINDWPTEYHFSYARHNLLRHISLGPIDCILELGCGCGAITRYLGETGATVIAVEGSRRRASIAAERCRDLPNVKVYCDNLQYFQSELRFSHVTLIGVLEYSRLFTEGDLPEMKCLLSASRNLLDGGQLLVAIENRLGLKYLNGCAEDHWGIPNAGLHNLYGSHTPVTFGRVELERLLLQAGLRAQEWMYPFPDYKLPTHIVHSRALTHTDFSIGDLLCDTNSRDYSGNQARTFHEGMVWGSLARNNALQDLSNSFLVSASSAKPKSSSSTRWLAACFNSGRRKPYLTQTTFMARDQGIDVSKQRLYPCTNEHTTAVCGHRLMHTPASLSAYVPGSLHAAEFQRQAGRALHLHELEPWLYQWLQFLRDEQKQAGLEAFNLPGHLLDAIPCNLVRDAAGKLRLIDKEWVMDASISLSWVLIRGMVKSLAQAPPCYVFEGLTFQLAITRLMELVDVNLTPTDFSRYAQQEQALQEAIQQHPLQNSVQNILSQSVYSNSRVGLGDRVENVLRSEIVRIKRSVSWRATAPLRLLQNMILQVITGLRALLLRIGPRGD